MSSWQNLMNYGLPLALGAGQWWQQRQASERAEGIYEDTKGIARRRFQSGMGMFGAGMEGILGQAAGRTAGALGEFDTREQQIMGGYGDQASRFGEAFEQRTADITAKLEGLGTQARKDIDRRYGDVSTQRQQALSARGFGGSTVGAAVEMGVQREKGAELGRLEEGLRRENIGLTSQLTGQALGAQMGLSQQTLGAQQQMMGNRLNLMTGLSGDQLQAHQSLLGQQMGMLTGLSGDYLNTVGNVNIGYPSQTNMQIAGQIGGGSYPVPDYGPSGWDQAMTGIGVASDIAGTVASFAALSDRDAKCDFESVDVDEILKQIEQLEISTWKYKGEDQRHTGPMAQDFKALGLGESERKIHIIDAFGVCLAAIKALASRVHELEGDT